LRALWVSSRNIREGEEEPKEPVEFIASEVVDEYLKRVAPFTALRSLGEVPEDSLEDIGLKDIKTHLRVECGRRSVEFEVGGSAYGSGERYIRKKGEKTVYLVDEAVVTELERAQQRMMQRELHRFETTEITGLTVKAFDRERNLLQRDRHEARTAQWVDADDPEQLNELYGNWLTRVERLRAQQYLALDAEPGSDMENVTVAAEPVVVIEYRGDGDAELGRLELVKVPAEQPEYYARTETTRAWVKVVRSLAQQVEDDVRPVVGLEPLEREEPAPPTPTTPATSTTPATPTPTPRPAPTKVAPVPVPTPTPPAAAHGHPH
jgi:hypothetical protein